MTDYLNFQAKFGPNPCFHDTIGPKRPESLAATPSPQFPPHVEDQPEQCSNNLKQLKIDYLFKIKTNLTSLLRHSFIETYFTYKHSFIETYLTYGAPYLFFMIWMFFQFGLFSIGYDRLISSPSYKTARTIFSIESLRLSRAAVIPMNFCTALILLSMNRKLVYLALNCPILPLFQSTPTLQRIHVTVGFTLLFWTIVHSIGHIFNALSFIRILPNYLFLLRIVLSPAWITGYLMLLSLFLMSVTSAPIFRRKLYECFQYIHLLFWIYIACLLAHGCFCFIPIDTLSGCSFPTAWLWVTVPLLLLLIEQIFKEFLTRGKFHIKTVVLHPSQVIELRIESKILKNYRPGQYIYLKVPKISRFQWHPFTLTSAPEEKILSVHIRVSGDWTAHLADQFATLTLSESQQTNSVESINLAIQVYSFFGATTRDIFKYSYLIFIGAGIGQTPFASLLKSFCLRRSQGELAHITKIIFIGVSRFSQALEWFHGILRSIETQDTLKTVSIRIYFTAPLDSLNIANLMLKKSYDWRDPVTGLASPSNFGRPNLQIIFKESAEEFICSISDAKQRIGLFFCGSPIFAASVQEAVLNHNSGHSVKIDYSSEFF
jgi:NADPH oxidase 2